MLRKKLQIQVSQVLCAEKAEGLTRLQAGVPLQLCWLATEGTQEPLLIKQVAQVPKGRQTLPASRPFAPSGLNPLRIFTGVTPACGLNALSGLCGRAFTTYET